MNGIVNLATRSVVAPVTLTAPVPQMSASRGVLAWQGTATVASTVGVRSQAPTYALATDKSVRSHHPEFVEFIEPIGNHSDASGAHAAAADRMTADLRAARLRNAHPATVTRSRHRSRLR